MRGQPHAVGFQTRFGQGSCVLVELGGVKTVLQHGGDLLVGQTIAGFDVNLGLHTAFGLYGAHAEQAIGVHCESDANTGRTSSHGRYALQFKTRQAAAVFHQITLALQHMKGQGGLSVLVGGEVLRHGGGNGLVARHDAFDQATHGFNAQ